ncbi:MAG TPA: S41 family peptidase [Clostridia bacterium]|nr:S41 family peptidase [Clostridia bacterium]
MSRKISIGITISLVITAITITFAITMSVSQRTYNRLITDLPERTQMYSSIAKIDELVRSNYYGKISEKVLNEKVAGGYVAGLGDAYSKYMTADEYADYVTVISGKSLGIGVTTTLNEANGYMTVTQVFSGSPAENSGLKKGDEITQIGGEPISAKNYEEMLKSFEGQNLSSVDITFKRETETKTVSVVVGYNLPSVSHRLIGDVGYIRITAFYENTAIQVSNAIHSLIESEAKSLIFDVRNTDKGSVEYAAQVIDLLVPVASEGTGALASAVDKNGQTVKVFSSNSTDVSLQMVVLVNSKTCGGAELFACDLRDFGKAWIVGNTTKGNGTMQEVFRLDDGGAVMLTVAKILPYKSDSFDGVGVVPDYESSLTFSQKSNFDLLEDEEDTQLQTALTLLSGNDE